MSTAPFLALEGLTRRFGSVTAMDQVTLGVERGGVLALLGPSGSGKTTTLRVLGGFEAPDAGRVLVDGRDVTGLPPATRRFGVVFQHYALFPHLDVAGNVAFGLESQRVPVAERARRVAEVLALVDLRGYESRRIEQLSGGQQQRVALARALVLEPQVLLLDEPLSNLDPALRERTRRELGTLIRRVGITSILVTHEQDDAFDLADRVAVLHQGRVEQVGTPDELYAHPHSAFVAAFIGRASRLEGRLTDSGLEVDGARWPRPTGAADLPAGPVEVLLRPEALRPGAPGPTALAVEVVARRFGGAVAFYQLRTPTGAIVDVALAPEAAALGDRLHLVPTGPGVHVFPPAPA